MSFYPSLASPQQISILLIISLLRWTFFGRIFIACSPFPIGAVSVMRSYFLLSRPQGPLFSFQSGRYLTRSAVVHLLRDAAQFAGLPYQSLKGHSFRIGATSTAAAACLPDWLINVLGRWFPDCYQLGIITPHNVLLSAAPRMASVSFSPVRA